MTDNRTTELLRKLLDERGVDYTANDHMGAYETSWNGFTATQLSPNANLIMAVTPEQAIAATLGSDDEYEAKMDALLCMLTNGKWSKSRAYSLDFMVSCVDEEYEDAYEKERAELGSGTCENLEKRNASLWFVCSRCGAQAGNGTYSEEWMHQDHTDEECAEYDGEPFNFCPSCGARIRKAVKR